MLDSTKMMQDLVGSGLVTPEQFEEARRCVSGRRTSLDKALALLNIIGFEELGKCFSRMYAMPYMPISTISPPEQVRRMLSPKCALFWKVFPWHYDEETNILTVAVHDSDQIVTIERVHAFFMQSYSLAFTVASQAEIEDALEQHFVAPKTKAISTSRLRSREEATPAEGGEAQAAEGKPDEAKPDEAKPAGLPQKKKMQIRARQEEGDAGKKKTPADGSAAAARLVTGAAGDIAYADMGRALVSLAAVAAKTFLGEDREKLREISARARYCELLCSRLAMPQTEADTTVFAAWLSALEDRHEILDQLVTPYRIEEVLYPDKAGSEERPEASVLSLVKCYQRLSATDPETAKDVNLTRRQLHRSWSASLHRQHMLEKFLQVLMDEQFLSKLDRTTGRIIIVDPAEFARSVLVSPLSSLGYEIKTASTAEVAEELMVDFKPDIVIVERRLPRMSGARFCRKMKADPKTARIPLIALVDKGAEAYAAEMLREGADEALTKPVDLELLFVKINRFMEVRDAGERAGVSGNLRDMGFTDMIQIICAGGRNMEIVLAAGDREGRVFVKEGEIVHAALGDKTGSDAFFALMKWREGEFTTRPCSEFSERTINESAMSLLMEGSRLVDEAGEEKDSGEKTPSGEPEVAPLQDTPAATTS